MFISQSVQEFMNSPISKTLRFAGWKMDMCPAPLFAQTKSSQTVPELAKIISREGGFMDGNTALE
jgi:hypothetical protein